MKALNNNERNSAILRFSLWFVLCVLIICIPIVLTTYIPKEQLNSQAKENAALIEEINFEKEYFAGELQKIMDLMTKIKAKEISSNVFDAELINIINGIKKQTENDLNWRGKMYRNVIVIAEYLIDANKIQEEARKKMEDALKELEDTKNKIKTPLNQVIVEFESCGESISSLTKKRRGDCQDAAKNVDKQFKKAIKMLNNFKADI